MDPHASVEGGSTSRGVGRASVVARSPVGGCDCEANLLMVTCDKDQRRDTFMRGLGWKVIRIKL